MRRDDCGKPGRPRTYQTTKAPVSPPTGAQDESIKIASTGLRSVDLLDLRDGQDVLAALFLDIAGDLHLDRGVLRGGADAQRLVRLLALRADEVIVGRLAALIGHDNVLALRLLLECALGADRVAGDRLDFGGDR